MSLLLYAVLLALTAVIAGVVPTLLFLRTAADRRVLWVGGIAVALSYGHAIVGLPSLIDLAVNGLSVYPVWAAAVAFPVALLWRLLTAAAPPPLTEEEKMDAIRAKARARAAAFRSGRRG